jgi:hypothetical protein
MQYQLLTDLSHPSRHPGLTHQRHQETSLTFPKTIRHYSAMNSTNLTGTCPSAGGNTSHKGDFEVALTLGIIHTALMVLAVVLAYAQFRRTPPRVKPE